MPLLGLAQAARVTDRNFESDTLMAEALPTGINKAHQGAERMRSKLNLYFGEMIDFIVDAGGDVVKFAGDALMAVWRLEAGAAMHSWS
jgi:hypothetical protein